MTRALVAGAGTQATIAVVQFVLVDIIARSSRPPVRVRRGTPVEVCRGMCTVPQVEVNPLLKFTAFKGTVHAKT